MAEEKRSLIPIVNVAHNEDDSGFMFQVDLAGASKESVDLDMDNAGFCVKAEGEDFRYESCYMLVHEVKPTEATAKFSSWLLKIEVPFKEATRGTKIIIDQRYNKTSGLAVGDGSCAASVQAYAVARVRPQIIEASAFEEKRISRLWEANRGRFIRRLL